MSVGEPFVCYEGDSFRASGPVVDEGNGESRPDAVE